MRDLQHETPAVQDEEPAWVQRMRAKGYKIRRGTGPAMSEIPDAFFYPPPSAPRLFAQRVISALRKVLGSNPSTQAGNAPLP